MARDYICLYHSYLDAIQALGDAERGRLLTAMLEYSITGEAPQLNGNERFLFPMIKAQIDRDRTRYDAICQKNSDNVRKRSLTTDNDRKRSNTNGYKGEGKGEREEKGKGESSPPVSPSPGDHTRKKFVPPTLEEVSQYCRERSSPVDPKKFWEYFSTPDSQGRTWIDSEGKPVRNWKQKLLTWEKFNPGKRQEPRGKPTLGTAEEINESAWNYVRDLHRKKEEAW